MSKVFMDGGSGLNLLFASTMKAMGVTVDMLQESDTGFHGIILTLPTYPLGKISLDVVFGTPDNFRKERLEFELKMPGNNGTTITVHGSFSRSDNCDKDFQKIASKFGVREELNALDVLTDHKQPPTDNRSTRADEFDVAKEAKTHQVHPSDPKKTINASADLTVA
ncbi:uncharacterized protein [Lolium perenne]|uniref:uncharacterized protein n=1 Tax=Lolium perenne TaxID=4522 RepID=UPI0021F54E8D|nr:uncharacterized protein LOC127325622 [Lolium perenne]